MQTACGCCSQEEFNSYYGVKRSPPEQRDPPSPPSSFTIPPPSYSAIVYVRSPAAAMDIMGEKESEKNL